MNVLGWNVTAYRNYCLRPFFYFQGRYYSGAVKIVHIGPLALRFSRLRCDAGGAA